MLLCPASMLRARRSAKSTLHDQIGARSLCGADEGGGKRLDLRTGCWLSALEGENGGRRGEDSECSDDEARAKRMPSCTAAESAGREASEA